MEDSDLVAALSLAAAKREQIAQQLKLQKIQEIHNHFDKDQDGYLNHAELSSLQSFTSVTSSKVNGTPSSESSGKESANGKVDESSVRMSRKQYKMICTSLGCKPKQGLDVDALAMTYESGGGSSVDNDYDLVFGIKRDPAKAPAQSQSELDSLIGLLTAGDDPIISRASIASNSVPSFTDELIKQLHDGNSLSHNKKDRSDVKKKSNRKLSTVREAPSSAAEEVNKNLDVHTVKDKVGKDDCNCICSIM